MDNRITLNENSFKKVDKVTINEETTYTHSLIKDILREFKKNKLALVCLAILTIITIMSILAPYIVNYGPNEQDVLNKLAPASRDHIFGTDELGRDYFSRSLYGGRISLSVGFLSMIISTFIGILVGTISGYYGGAIDSILMRFTDIFLTLPSFLLIVVINTIFPPNLISMIIILGLFEWCQIARVIRAEVMSLKEREFILASKHLGASSIYILKKHILPNIVPSIIVASSLAVARAILTESSLSFLGVGVQLPAASWGTLLRGAQAYILTSPSLAIYPGIFIVLTVLSFNVIGDAFRGVFESR